MSRVVATRWMNLFTAQVAVTAAPTTALQGVAIPPGRHGKSVIIRLRHTATGARTCTVTLYGYCPGEKTFREGGTGIEEGTDISSTAGWDDLNESYSLASVSADGSITAFVLESPTVYSRLYARITAITGTSCTLGAAVAFTEE